MIIRFGFSLRRISLLIAVGAALCAAALPSAAQVLKRDGVWAQSYVDRPADPDVRFGQLENGMRYAVRRNATPVGATSMRLWIGAGSLVEREDQQGLAHFLEHMAFRGSARVPAGDLVRILQRLGLSFGADTNASTGQDATIYKFDLPQTDRESVDTGLMLLREIASELTLAQSEMDPERGVLLSEERVRDGPGYRQSIAEYGFQLEGQLAARRLPIGKTEVLRDAPVSVMRDYYEAHYRPDNAAVVAVGDFDPAEMEAAIRARFADWRAKAPAPAAPDLGSVIRRGATMRVLAMPGLAPSLSLTWVEPYDATADTAAANRRDLIDMLAFAVLNRRLERLAQAADAPFLSAGAGQGNIARSAHITRLSVQPKPDAWAAALTAAVLEQRRLLAHGVLPGEVAREATEVLTSLRIAAAGAATRPSARLADGIVRTIGNNDVFSSPAQDLAEVQAILPGVTAGEIDAAAKRLFAGNGPLVMLAGPAAIEGGEAAVGAVFAAAQATPVVAATAEAAKSWPYGPAAQPGVVAERSEVADLGLVLVRFANGVRLTVKQTDFSREEILVRLRVGQGRLGIPPERAQASWQVGGTPLLRLGGTQELTWEEIQALTAENRLGVAVSLEDDAFVLSGTTRGSDLDRQMQLLGAYVTRPAFRASAFERLKAGLVNRLAQSDATASGVFARVAGPALHGGDLRWLRSPDAAALTASAAGDLPALLGRDFAEGPLEVVVVGDITPDRAIAAVAATFGALPPRPARQPVETARAGIFAPAPMVVTHAGRPDQAMTMLAWPTDDFFADPQAQRVLGVTVAILRARLTDRLRSAEGVTYSPSVDSDSSRVFKGFGYVAAVAETPLTRLDAFQAAVDDIVAGMQAAPPSVDELDRAKRPLVDRRIRVLRENDYWSGALSAAQGDARQFDGIRNLVSGTERVTGEEVMLAARRYLTQASAMRLVVRPAGVN